jgi:hypothetical protein
MQPIQLKSCFGEERLAKSSTFALMVNGSVPANPRNQASAIVDVRLVAQAAEAESLSASNFISPALDIIMYASHVVAL